MSKRKMTTPEWDKRMMAAAALINDSPDYTKKEFVHAMEGADATAFALGLVIAAYTLNDKLCGMALIASMTQMIQYGFDETVKTLKKDDAARRKKSK